MTIKNEKIGKRILVGITVVIQLLTIAVILLNYSLFTNTLIKNKNWQVSKTQLFKPGQDGVDFEKKLPALAKNALNLGAWRGWHEVVLKKTFLWKNLSLRFLPSCNSYLYVIFHRTDKEFSAVRISYSPLYSSALISAKYSGEFTEFIPISIPKLNGSGWQEIVLKKSSSKSQTVEVWYNNEMIATYHSQTPVDGSIAFRTGKEALLVDDIKMEDDNNQILFNEKFNQLGSFWLKFSVLICILVLIDFGIWFVLKNKTNLFKSIIRVNFTICLMLILINLILLICNTQLRSRYYYENSFKNELKKKLGIASTFGKFNAEESVWLKNSDEKILSTYLPTTNDRQKTRIMFIGSSQTEGEGIAFPGEDFVSQFAKLLEQGLLNSNKKFEVINTGRPGQLSKDLFVYFQNQWLKLKPDIVIINLSSNDEEYENGINFESALEDFVRLSRERNFKLIFVAEPNSIEYKNKLKTHQIMQEVAEKNQITFINMHNKLIEHQEEGIIWWDFVHPTSFGYKLMASHLYESLEEELLY